MWKEPTWMTFGVITALNIKEFLEINLGCTSWDDVPEHVKNICYKHYPDRRPGLPVWDAIIPDR